jgi:hypothetical protein
MKAKKLAFGKICGPNSFHKTDSIRKGYTFFINMSKVDLIRRQYVIISQELELLKTEL